MTAFQPDHVLCPVRLADVDDVDVARDLVAQAADAAQTFGALITILTVQPPDAPPPPDVAHVGAAVAAMTDRLRRRIARAHGALGDLETIARARGLTVRSILLSEAGPVADAIVDAAEQEGCDLIVLGDTGRHGVRHALGGGVAERVAHRAKVPVLVLHVDRPVHHPLPPG